VPPCDGNRLASRHQTLQHVLPLLQKLVLCRLNKNRQAPRFVQ
jgi:hypothetical protein